MAQFEYPEETNRKFEGGDHQYDPAADQVDQPISYEAVTATEGQGTVPDIEDALPDKAGAADMPTRRPFGELTVVTREATHPLLRAEVVDPHELAAFYYSTASMSHNRQAWYDVERTLADPGANHLASALSHVNQSIREHAPVEPDPTDFFAGKFATDSDAQQWYEAARTKAFLPAFDARAATGQVTTDAAGVAYWDLTKNVLPNCVTDGNRAEALVGALGAREGFMVDPRRFLYPTSPREGNNSYRPDGKSLNHDYAMIGDDNSKIPVEAKVRGSTTTRSSHYDPRIAIVRFVNDIGPAILGTELPNAKSVGQAVPVVLARTEQLMAQELDRSIRVPELDAAASALYRAIAARRS